jgi:hypothetical protein
MSVMGVASIYAEMRLLQVVRDGGVVGITDGSAGHMFDPAQARTLWGLLERSLSNDERGVGVMGTVMTLDGRTLHVKRSAAAVSIIDGSPADHGLWTLRLRDQVASLRDALDRATSDANAQ